MFSNSIFSQISLRTPNGTTTASSASTSVTISKPAGAVQGDLMLMNVAQASNNSTIATPSGWTLISGYSVTSGSNKNYASVFYKLVSATEPASYTLTIPSATIASIVTFSGVDNVNPIEAFTPSSAAAVSSTTAMNAATITTLNPNSAVVLFGQAIGSSQTWSNWNTTSPGSLTEVFDNASTSASVGAAWLTKTTAGATGNGTATVSAAGLNSGILVSLKRQAELSIGSSTLSAFTTTYGAASSTQTISVSGSYLNGNITISAPAGFEVSTNGTTFASSVSLTPASGTVNATTIYIRLAATAPAGNYNNLQFSISSSGAVTLTLATTSTGNLVSRRDLFITASNISKCQGIGTSFAGTEFASSGLQNGETIGSVTLASTGSGAAAAAGTYPIIPSAAAGGSFLSNNYNLFYNNGTLTVNSLPSVPTGVNGSRCGTGTVLLSATPGAGETIDWYTVSTGGTALSTGSTSYTTASISATTLYYAETRNLTTGCKSSSRVTVTATVNALPAAPGAVSASRCGTGSVTISATAGAGETIDWYAAATGGAAISSGSASFTTGSISVTTTYYAEARNTTTGCVSATRTAVTATVNAVPAAPTGTGASRCGAGSVTISATVGAGLTVDWYDAATGGTLLQGGVTNYTTASLTATTIYYAEARNTTTGCVSATRVAVTATINDLPSVPAGVNGSRCGTGAVLLSATPGAGETIDWYSVSTGGTALSTGSTSYTTASISATTLYYAEARNLTTGCKSSSRVTVTATVNALPVTPGAVSASRCGTGSVTISATAGAGETIDWYAAATGGAAISSGSASFTTGSISVTTTYYAEARNTTTGCVSATRTAVTATVNAVPAAPTGTGASRCGAGSVTISATVGAGLTVDWYDAAAGGTLLQGGVTNYTTASLTATTIYYAEARNTTTGCVSATRVAVTATINDLPSVPAGVNGSRCGTGAVLLSATPGAGETIDWYSVSTGGTALSTGSTSYTTASISATTLYYAEARNLTTGCKSSSRVTVTATVNALPALPGAVSASRCGTGSVTISATAGAGETIDWYAAATGGAAISSGSASFTTGSISVTTTYYAEARNTTTGCVSAARVAVTATVNAVPASVSASSSISTNCGPATFLLSGTAAVESRSITGLQNFESAGSTLTYTASGGQLYSGNSGSNDFPASTPFYSSATSSYGISNGTAVITTANITGLGGFSSKVASVRLASFAMNSSDAADNTDSVVVAVSINGGSTFSNELVVKGNTNAYWGFASGTGTATVNYSGINQPVIFAPAAGGARTTDGFSTLQVAIPDTASQVIIRVTLVNNSNKELWLADDIQLSRTNMNFSWTSNPAGFTSVLLSPGNVTAASSTVYTLTATGGNGCTSSATTNIVINPLPASPTGTGAARCGNGSVTISATPTGANEVIDWYAAPTGGSVLPSGTGTNNYNTQSLSVTTVYYAQSRNTITGCISASRTSVTATINNLPTVIAITDGAICFSGTTTLSASTVAGGVINWYSSVTGGSLLAPASNTFTTPVINTTTSYYAEAVSAAGCVGPVRAVVVATVNPLPALPGGNNGSNCGTGPVTLSATVPAGITVDWFDVPSGGAVLTNGLGVTTFTTNSLAVTTIFYAQARNLVTGCVSSSRTAVTATIYPVPSAPVSTGASYAICGSGSINIAVNVAGSNETSDWYAASSGGSILTGGSNVTSFNTPVISTTTIFYAQTRNTVTGCVSASRTPVNVVVNPLPAAPVVTGGSVCDQGSINLSATPAAGCAADWYAGLTGNNLLLSASGNYSTPVLNTTTVYYVVSRNTTTGCLSAPRTPVTATVNPNLPASVSISSNAVNNTICAGSAITFTANPVNGGTAPVYQWTLNGVNVGTNSPIYTSNSITSGQTIAVRMTSNAAPCLLGSPASSNIITVTVNPNAGSAVGFDSSNCGSGVVTIRAAAGVNEVIDWYNAPVGGTLLASSSNFYTTINLASSTVYYAVARNINTGCVSVSRTAVNAIIAAVPVVTCPGDFSVCNLNPITLSGFSPAGGVLTGPASGLSGFVFNPAQAGGVGRYDFNYTYTNAQGCSSRCNFSIQAATTPPVVTPSSPSYFIYSGTSTNIVLNSNMLGTTYTWTVVNNASVITGYSNQTAAVPGPIVQTLYNNGNVAGELSYIITPSLNGTCQGSPVTVYVTIPNSTFCDDPGSFLAGSCIINMGVTPQTVGNGLKPYGLVYDLVNNYKIPVYWCFRDNKNFQSSVTKVDQIDFTLDGVNYRGGTFVIPSTFVPQVQSVINSWVSQGVVVAYSSTSFSTPVYDIITRMPNVVLDANTGYLLQSGFYVKAGIPASAYTLGGIPTNITGCDDIYALPHALPQNWSQATKDSLRSFINTRGWLYTSCCSVSGIENIPNLNFLTTGGLIPYNSHASATVPYNYSLRAGSEGTTVASDPYMQFTGTLDGAINYGLENVYLPVTSWRPTTKIAIYDSNFVSNSTTYPNNAAILAYGRAYGDTSKGMVMYMGGHDFEHGTEAEDVAAARVYANFILRAGINARPKVIPANIPTEGYSGQTLPISVTVPPTQSGFVSYEWFSDIGAIFGSNSLSTTITLPAVDVVTVANIQFKVKDACGRIGFYCTTLRINPTIVNNRISASQSICAGLQIDTLRGTLPAVQSGRTITYQWAMSTSGPALGFSPAPGVNTQRNYMPPALAAGTYWFRRKVTADTISVFSTSIQITIKPSPTVVALINSASHDVSLCSGQSASLSSTGLNSVDTLTYLSLSNVQDRAITDNNPRGIRDTINVTGAPSSISQLLNISVKVNISHTYASDIELYLIRPGGTLTQTATGNYTNTVIGGQSIALVADRGGAGANFIGTVFTDSAATPIGSGIAPFTGYYKPENAFSTFTPSANPNGNWILVAVDDAATDIGSILDWTITMKFRNNITYTWSSLPAGFSSSLQNPGTVTPAVSTSYIVTVSELNNTCTGKDTLNAIVSPPTVAGTISGPSVICTGTFDSVRITGNTGTVQWQSSTDNITYTNITGATANRYLLNSITTNTYFRAVVQSGACSPAITNSILVTVVAAPTVSNAGPDQLSICGNTILLAANTPVTGAGSWSIVSGGGGNISSPGSPNSAFSGSSDSTYVLRWTIVNSPCTASTDEVVIRFNTPVAIVTQPTTPVLPYCQNSNSNITFTVNGTAPLTYQWYSNTSNSNLGGLPIAGANAGSYSLPYSATGTFYYYCTVANACGSQTTNAVKAIVVRSGSWLGVNTSWNDPVNWCGGVPNEDANIVIPAGLLNYPVITSNDAIVKDVLLEGGSITITSTGALTLFGAVTQTGGIINARNGTIEFTGDTTQIINNGLLSGDNLGSLIINNVSVKLGGPLNILNKISFKGNDRVLYTNDLLTLKSSDTLTASVSDVSNNQTSFGNNIVGKVTVERFASSRRAWRLLCPPTRHDFQTIKQAWQEGATTPNANTVPGFGIQITSNRTSWLADGFDTFSIAGPSMKVYNPATNLYEGVASTNSNFSIGKAYMTFVRGDRSVTQLTQAPTTTILREKGSLFVGDTSFVIGTAGSQFVSAGNPYASPVDFIKLSRTNLEPSYYLWDPKLSTYGAYQTCLISGNTILNVPGGGSYASGNYNIQSGQGFFVRTTTGAGLLTFKESAKADGSVQFNRAPGNLAMFRTNLYQLQNGNPVLYDGVLNIFDSSFSDGPDVMDALKLGNTNENLSVRKNDKLYAIESRSGLSGNDTIQFRLGQVRLTSYRYEFIPASMSGYNVQAFFEDSYLNSRVPVSMTDTTRIDFTITNAAGSYQPERFRIVFNTLRPLPVTITSLSASRNKDLTVSVSWRSDNETSIGEYQVERCADGRQFSTIGSVLPALNNGGSAMYIQKDQDAGTELIYYRIKAVSTNGLIQYSNIARVAPVGLTQSVTVTPNPVTEEEINLLFAEMESGNYRIILFASDGKKIQESTMAVSGNHEYKKMRLKKHVTAGQYNLMVIAPDLSRKNIPVQIYR